MAEKWEIKGTYFEGCNCEAACPCVFLSPPTEGECTVLIGWHIAEGHYGSVQLGGLNVALMAHSPGHMLQTKWKGALYFDDKATAQQKDSLTQIFTGQAGSHLETLVSFVGEVMGVASVPIDYQASGRQRSMKLGDVAEIAIEALEGQNGQEVTLGALPLCVAPGYATVAAKSKKLSYQDHGYNLELSNKTGFYSPFAYQP